jgi:hypothetical protein
MRRMTGHGHPPLSHAGERFLLPSSSGSLWAFAYNSISHAPMRGSSPLAHDYYTRTGEGKSQAASQQRRLK